MWKGNSTRPQFAQCWPAAGNRDEDAAWVSRRGDIDKETDVNARHVTINTKTSVTKTLFQYDEEGDQEINPYSWRE